VLDGIYVADETGCIRFRQAAPPSDAEVARVTERIQHQITRLLERRGLGPQADGDESDALRNSQPLLAELYGASVCGRVATGPRAGRKIAKVGDAVDLEDIAVPSGPRCAAIAGYSVHANVCIPAHDRMRLERLCRYAGRPPVATERLSLLPDGRLLYRLKHRWRDGTTHMIFEPLELVEKLAALVPPPRFNLVRYHGVLAPSAAWRPLIIPSEPEPEIAAPSFHPACPAKEQILSETENLQTRRAPEITNLASHPSCSAKKQIPENPQKKRACRPRNYSWAELMRRVFSIDVLVCPRCGGRMRILCAIHPPEAIHKILECLGLPSRPPPIARALPDPEIEGFEFS
jgi:hypothetical protein